MKSAIMVGHPDPSSFTLAMANTCATCLSAHGQETFVRDLCRLDFDPCLKLSEMSNRPGWDTGADAELEQQLSADARAFAFFWPDTPAYGS